jgi:glycerol-1-phosphate dehydrogenase [NAD(P)+]
VSLVHETIDRAPCGCGRCRAPGTAIHGIVTDLAEQTQKLIDVSGRAQDGIVIIGDRNTLTACGNELGSALALRGYSVRTIELDAYADLADAESLAADLAALAGSFAIAVGSGTVNDLVKHATYLRGEEYGCVATAASMNGYTSSVAALSVGGVKRTLSSQAPRFVIADADVLARAPEAMSRAGLADLLSKAVSSADWKLAHLVTGEPYCETPIELANDAVERAVQTAPALRIGDPSAAAALFEALLASGTSMTVAGHSAPASGGEHLISHFLDMTAKEAPGGPRAPALHGLQVGVGTRICCRLWETVLDMDVPTATQPTEAFEVSARIRETAPWLRPETASAIADIGQEKLTALGANGMARREALTKRWDEIRDRFQEDVRQAGRFTRILDTVQVPGSAEELGAAPEELSAAIRLGRFIRDRYTILDLADDLLGLP